MKVLCVTGYKKMIVNNIYEAHISRSGQRVNVVIDANTQYSFYRYTPGHFRSDDDDVKYIRYIKE